MKKTFTVLELDCANCAAKMENEISKIDGVIKAKVSFMTQKLVLEAEDSVFDEIVEKAKKAVKKVDSACTLIAVKKAND